ncbi:hypothetical protein KAE78_15180 (plasmid) [Microbacterium sp. NIBRBAC000506063]|nr:hypothetical protein KAE78_15180 [Microbacterium sp. NIBRBAC000506063]
MPCRPSPGWRRCWARSRSRRASASWSSWAPQAHAPERAAPPPPERSWRPSAPRGRCAWSASPATRGTRARSHAVVGAGGGCLPGGARRLRRRGRRGGAPAQLIVSAGGSAYLDLVAEHLASCREAGLRVVVRSGASLTHDDGFYEDISPLSDANALDRDSSLRSAMVGFARIISMPEPGLALCDAGKRDFPFDEGLPVPLAWSAAPGAAEQPLLDAHVTALNDQHLFLRLAPDAEGPALGDVVRFGLSHPCTAFDKWRRIPEFRADGTIVAVHDTRF